MELKELTQKIKQFSEERGWNKNIQPDDLAKSLIIEAAELLEHFQWDSTREKRETSNPKDKEEIGNEIADVIIYAIRLSYVLGFDVDDILTKKIERNGKKYPLNTTG